MMSYQISIHHMLILIQLSRAIELQSLNFNTSYVDINLYPETFGAKGDGDFNTSYVDINLSCLVKPT